MRIDFLTLFPEMCETVLNESILGRARQKGLIAYHCHCIRDYTDDKHRRVDDYPYGGSQGMLLKPEPIAACFDAIEKNVGERVYKIYMSPKGSIFTQKKAQILSTMNNIAILCGHYEGVDERLLEEYIDEEISIGDFVLTGGELPALAVADSVTRLIPGVLSEDVCFKDESHFSGLLEYPQYTRPPVWRNKEVPEVLLSGHHANIEKWRREESIRETLNKRPDLLDNMHKN